MKTKISWKNLVIVVLLSTIILIPLTTLSFMLRILGLWEPLQVGIIGGLWSLGVWSFNRVWPVRL